MNSINLLGSQITYYHKVIQISIKRLLFLLDFENSVHKGERRYVHICGWNLPGSTSLLAECHQIMCKADILLGSFFQRNPQKNRNFRLKIGYNSGCNIKYTWLLKVEYLLTDLYEI